MCIRDSDYVAQLQEAIAFRKPGDVVNVEVARKGGQHATVRVALQRAGGAVETELTDDAAERHLTAPDAGGPDIILSVEGTAVETPEQLRAALAKAKSGEIVTLRVYN